MTSFSFKLWPELSKRVYFSNPLFSGLDVVGLVSRLPYLGDHLKESAVAAGATTFVMAYAVHKVFAPVRIGITLTSAPFLVNYLRSKGILKVKKTWKHLIQLWSYYYYNPAIDAANEEWHTFLHGVNLEFVISIIFLYETINLKTWVRS